VTKGKGETTRPHSEVLAPPSTGDPARVPSPRLGPFVIERELARGGMGIVYIARHEQLGRRVALKVMKTGSWPDPEDAERFRFEAQAAARLKHPNIVGLDSLSRSLPDRTLT